MKRIFYPIITIVLSCLGVTVNAQPNILNPADPEIVYTASNHPPAPAWNSMSKWGHTRRLGWNSFNLGYKGYYFKGMAIRLKFPKTYAHNVNDGKKYPLFVFLHGLGERGNIWDNEWSLLHGGQFHGNLVNDGKFDGFLFYPQNQNGYSNSLFMQITEFIDSMAKYVKVDIDRVVVSGLSSGGQGVWDFCADYSRYFATAIPISAAQLEDMAYFNRYINMPIWATNGGNDNNPDPGTATQVFNDFRSRGGELKQTFYPTMAHGVWNTFWNEAAYWPYLSARHKADPNVHFGHKDFCPGEPVNARLGLQSGFNAYEWRRNGTIIPGATANEYVATTYGTYDCRFRRTATGNWSDWSPHPVTVGVKLATVTPPIQINGMKSKVLPAPDGSTTVPLMVPDTYQSYEWRRVSDNAIVSTINNYNAPVGQFKVKVTEQFGCSSDFSPIFTVVNANGTNLPDKATNIILTTLSNTAIQVDWSDNPTPNYNETGFEIYRGTAPGGPYQLVAINPANNVSYLDDGLLPKTRYYYIIRSINDNGASPNSDEKNAITNSDINPPTAPGNLTITGTARTYIALAWTASTDDVGINKYDIYVNGKKSYSTDQTSFVVNNLTPLSTYNIFVKARDLSGNLSPASNQVTSVAKLSGLNYKYYQGTWSALPNFSDLTPVATGVILNVSLSPALRLDNFGFLYEGFIKIPVTGTYFFETRSDDGSKLYIGQYNHTATPVVNNDGLHGSQYRGGNITLQAGVYPIAMTFFEQGGGELMEVFWTCAAAGILTRTQIPNSAFNDTNTPPGTIPALPTVLKATPLSHNQINLTWLDNSSNEAGFEIYRATSFNGAYTQIITVPANTQSYIDSGINSATKYFYKVRAIGTAGESDYVFSYVEANWLFNNNYIDSSGNGRTLTQNASPVFSAATKIEGTHSIQFNGATQYLNIPSTVTWLRESYFERTVACWINSQSNTNNRMIFDIGGGDNGLALRLNTNTLIAGVASSNTRISISAPYTSNTWNFVTVVYNRNSIRLYVNGVQVAANNSLSFSSLAASVSAARIAYFNGSNAFSLGTTGLFQGWIDNFTIINSALTAADVVNLMNETFIPSNATTLNLPALPGTPNNLVANAPSSSVINLSWNDNATNELSYEVWRSVNNNTNYRLLATIQDISGSSAVYSDSGLFANALYYYKVRAIGVGGPTPYSAETSTTTLNNLPVLTGIQNFSMRHSSSKTIGVNGIDADGEALTIVVNNMPAFGSFNPTGNGAGNIILNPTSAQQGNYTLQVIISDTHAGKDTVSFNVIVNSNYQPVLAAIGNQTIGEGSVGNVPVSATDIDGTASLSWSTNGLPAFATLTTTPGGTGNIQLLPGYAHSGSYNVSVTVNDGAGGTDTKSFTITVNEVNPSSTQIFVSVKDAASPAAPAPWNNLTGGLTNNLRDQNSNVTPIGVNFVGASWQTFTAGAVTGNNSGVYPDAVIRDQYWFGYYGVPNTINLRLTGLNASYKYRLTLFSSSVWNGVPDNGSTVFTINGVSQTLNVQGNTQNTVSFNGLVPDASGFINITLSKGATTPVGYLNAFVLEQVYDDGTAPVLPTNITAQNLSNGFVKLSWKDVAYNESRYEIYRATSAAGPYTLLNAGASNANDTLYTDQTAPSRTTLYYKLMAVNNYGNSGMTGAVSVTTNNKAPVMNPITNQFVKTDNNVVVNFAGIDDPGETLTVEISNLPAFGSYLNTGNGTGQITFAPGSNHLGIYKNISVKVADGYGGSVTRTFEVTVSDKNTRSIFVNFGTDSDMPVDQPWNSFHGYPFAGITLNNLRDEANLSTNYNLTSVDSWSGNYRGGMITGSNSGIYPDNVMESGFYEASTTAKRLRFTGLNPTKKYNVAIFGSVNAGYSANATYATGAQNTALNSRYNSKQVAMLNGLVPTGGQIEVSITKAAAETYSYLSAVVLEEYDNTLTLLRPMNLFAEPDSTTRVKLVWADRSNDETGFQVWRSGTLNGTYSLVTTLGANVTSYTNQSLSPNTRYFYKVRAINGGVLGDFSNTATAVLANKIVYIDFEASFPAPLPWNGTNAQLVDGVKVTNFKNNTNDFTGFGMDVLQGFNDEFGGGLTNGIYPDNVMISNFWLDKNQLVNLKFDNLDQSKKYRIRFFGSSDWGYLIDFTTTYTVNGKTVYLNCYKNNSKAVYIENLEPTEDGEIFATISTTPSATYGFAAAVLIESYEDPIGGAGATEGGGRFVQTPVVEETDIEIVTETVTENVLEETVKKNEIKVYPNPFNDVLNVSISNSEKSSFSIQVFDISGRLVHRKDLKDLDPGKRTEQLNFSQSNLTSGTYFIRIMRNNNVEKTIKLIKSRN